MSDNAVAEIMVEFERNPMLWAQYFFPHHFRIQSPFFHIEVLQECIANSHLAIAAPRESAKSTILLFSYQFHQIVFKKKHFIVILSNTFSKAAMALDAIKREIKKPEAKINQLNLEIQKDAEGDSVIKHGDGFETRILCKGAEQIGSIRGVKFGAYRPDLIIVDDVEDDEMVKSPERRLDLQKQFDEALIPAGERGNCQYIVIGTILHDDSLLAKLLSKDNYPEFRKLFYRGLNKSKKTGKLVSLWEQKWTIDWLLQLSKLKPGVFAKEIQNNPVAGGMSRFNEKQFRYWNIDNNQYVLYSREGTVVSKGLMTDCRAAIANDLAWSERKEADSTVIMPAFLTPQNDLLVYKYIVERGMRPDRFAEYLFTMEAKLRGMTGSVIPIGFEKAMLEKAVQWSLKQEMRRRNKYLLLKPLKWDKDKISRIDITLQPRYAQNVVYHMRGMGDLEHQLVRFPSGKHDDIIDALQGVCRLLSNPKTIKATVDDDAGFEFWRTQAINYYKKAYKKEKVPYTFGHKKWKKKEIPSTITYK